MPGIKRQTAIKCTISRILNGKYVVQQGWEPNFIESGNLKIMRINILAVITQKEVNTLTIDDGTGTLLVRVFENPERLNQYNVGDVILIIGRPREYNNQKYLVPEIIRKIENKKWIDYRKKELENQTINQRVPVQEESLQEPLREETLDEINIHNEVDEIRIVEKNPGQNKTSILISTIRKLDDGKGAAIEEVIKESGLEDAEEYLEQLLSEGEIYEIRKGKLKVLD